MSKFSPLLTDLYELTMAQGYFYSNNNPKVVFDMFFRRAPYNGGFSIYAGLEDLLKTVLDMEFSNSDIKYLKSLNIFKKDFLIYLKKFKFSGDIYSVKEGSLVFPGEPIIRVHGNLIECQLLESFLLNIINFQTLIATKSARIYWASEKSTILEFGLRRSQGIDGALSASKAAFIGGTSGTSNTLAGKKYGIPVKGTMAHSWVMAFNNELESFDKYSALYPDSTVLLIDTYNTLKSGLPNAIKTALNLKKIGKTIGVRLDSGDLNYLSKEVRKVLDYSGLQNAQIGVSGDLNEEIIHQLVSNKAPIDVWGVGTQLTTGHPDSALTGVYKLASIEIEGNSIPKIKLSDNPKKLTNPGIKQVFRIFDENNAPQGDVIALNHEESKNIINNEIFDPTMPYKKKKINKSYTLKPLLNHVFGNNEIKIKLPKIADIRKFVLNQLDSLDDSYKRLINPHKYKVSLSKQLNELKYRMINENSNKK